MQRCHRRKSLSLLLLYRDTITTEDFGYQNLTATILLFKPDNSFDQFAIRVCEEEGQKIPIGHLPREVSRVTKYLID